MKILLLKTKVNCPPLICFSFIHDSKYTYKKEIQLNKCTLFLFDLFSFRHWTSSIKTRRFSIKILAPLPHPPKKTNYLVLKLVGGFMWGSLWKQRTVKILIAVHQRALKSYPFFDFFPSEHQRLSFSCHSYLVCFHLSFLIFPLYCSSPLWNISKVITSP